jgi:hypothetical protein
MRIYGRVAGLVTKSIGFAMAIRSIVFFGHLGNVPLIKVALFDPIDGQKTSLYDAGRLLNVMYRWMGFKPMITWKAHSQMELVGSLYETTFILPKTQIILFNKERFEKWCSITTANKITLCDQVMWNEIEPVVTKSTTYPLLTAFLYNKDITKKLIPLLNSFKLTRITPYELAMYLGIQPELNQTIDALVVMSSDDLSITSFKDNEVIKL